MDGIDLVQANQETWLRQIGAVEQDVFLLNDSIGKNIVFGSKNISNKDMRAASKIARADEFIKALPSGYDSVIGDRGLRLSGGQRQRVAIARALAMSPGLLLLDEPMASLDARLRGLVLSYLRRVHKDLGIPMVYVSHSISEVLALADDALVLSGGAVVSSGRPSRVLLDPAVGGLLRDEPVENLLDGTVLEPGGGGASGRVRVGNADIVTPPSDRAPDAPVIMALGAEEIILSTGEPSGLSARNAIAGLITELEPVGGLVYASVDIGVPVLVALTPGGLTR